MAPPYRVDHIGSLMRPQELIDSRTSITNASRGKKEPTADQLGNVEAVTKKAIQEVVNEQLQRGVTTITTGEFERNVFIDGFFESLSGIEKRHLPWEAFRPELPALKPLINWGLKGNNACVAVSKSRRTQSAYMDDWLQLRGCLPDETWGDAKMTVPAPTFQHLQLNEPYTADSGYSNDHEYLQDVASALREEILELYQAGLRNVQVDDPNLSCFCDEAWMSTLKSRGLEPDKWLDLYIAAHNTVLKDLPPDLNIGLHICRGNFPGGVFIVSGSYERIAARLFNETNYKHFCLEFDSPRAGDFGPLKHLPRDKAVVLGVVTTKSPELEDLPELKERVLAAADVIAKANNITQREALDGCLAVSPQCGFSSEHSGGGIGVTVETQWKKLELLQRLAEEIWPGWKTSRRQ